ncbi:MAG: KpsF/GutQ family sugar-phosphate isomerase [Alphaproteobacteria bacterium]|nr:KpsF/GutQ family sugar-phosphate isomerase [Alphaproteobacteria bacterium]
MTATNAMTKETLDASDIVEGRRVLNEEADALKALATSLDENFNAAINMVDSCRHNKNGRLVVTGVGKSGHVARKMVATLASTGTPALFVHPGEASHGDLGMITGNDVVLAISNSGEAPELAVILTYVKRFHIPLIAITSKPQSTLGTHADIILALPNLPEACPNGLAPTTSTTMTMALGDALAVALLKRIGLTPDQFKVFHPGGKLGQQLKLVSDLMLTPQDLAMCPPETTMGDALLVMAQKNLGSVIVADKDSKLLGIVTDGDLKRHMGPELLTKKIETIMTRGPRSIAPEVLAAEAIDVMLRRDGSMFTSLVVTDKNNVVKGLIRVQECLRAGLI